MTMVRTNLDNTRERAGQIRFEPVGSITATNVQDAITGGGAGLLPLTTPTVVTATGTLAATDVVVQANHTAPITLTLPGAAAWAAVNGSYGLPLTIVDISGLAATNNVTIVTQGGTTISGNASLTISNNFGSWSLLPRPSALGGGWIFV